MNKCLQESVFPFLIGVIKTIVGILTGSSAMISEAYHSFADTMNQILLAFGISWKSKSFKPYKGVSSNNAKVGLEFENEMFQTL